MATCLEVLRLHLFRQRWRLLFIYIGHENRNRTMMMTDDLATCSPVTFYNTQYTIHNTQYKIRNEAVVPRQLSERP